MNTISEQYLDEARQYRGSGWRKQLDAGRKRQEPRP